MDWIVFVLASLVLVALSVYALKLRYAIATAPQLRSPSSLGSEGGFQMPKVSVVIPAYNEAENVEECLRSVLNSTSLPSDLLEVWLVDDQSTDATWAIAQSLQQNLSDPRLKLVAGQPRPTGERWMGKNWACAQAVERASGEFLLFMDADVRLQPSAIEAAVQTAQAEGVDLLSCGPALICGCFSEWLVQPLMFSLLLVGFDFDSVNDPHNEMAFAAGPFMLFRRTAYEQIGGHRAVADQIVEDVELSRRIKQSGLRLLFLSGSQWVSVRMYRSWGALWEGWTKNLYLGSRRNLKATLLIVEVMLGLCTLPWLLLVFLAGKGAWVGLNGWDWGAIALSLCAVFTHYSLRRISVKESHIPTRYWWLTGIGGLVVAGIAIASIIKTETGWGWTWRGRSLAKVESD